MSLRRSTRISAGQLNATSKQFNGTARDETKASQNQKEIGAFPPTPAKSMKKRKASNPRSKAITAPSDEHIPSSPPPLFTQPAFIIPTLPSTPKSTKRARTNHAAFPTTPTPAGIAFLNSSPLPRSSPNHHPRLADPHKTNAPLQTPGGHKVVALPETTPEEGPEVNAASITTENLLQAAEAHLIANDPTGKLARCMQTHPCKLFSPDGLAEEVDPWRSLVSGIIGQQVSGAAAKSIKAKFVKLFSPAEGADSASFFPSPTQVVAADMPTLRSAGLSQRKAEYIVGLAEKFLDGTLSAGRLTTATDEEIMELLTSVRGLGRWSVEMFMCFSLKRADVFSTGDLGVQRGMASWLGRDVARLKTGGKGKWKYLSEKEMIDEAERFRPYRSLFMWYMWRIEDVDVDVLGA